MSGTVAIVGRPNVGKSTLFNRLVGARTAIVDDTPGVTRDRREGRAQFGGLEFRLIDTAGLEESDTGSLEDRMLRQTAAAVDAADVVLFVVDGRAGVTPADEFFADWLRRRGADVILVVNKCEGRAAATGIAESYAFGFGEPVAIAAEHGLGMADLVEALAPFLDREAAPGDAEPADGETAGPLRLAVVGRPNVGKSTLINRMIGEERLLTGPEAGITRDSIAVEWSWQGRAIELADTAGLRRKARVVERLEKLSTEDTLRTIRFAEVVVLVLDATVMLERQDLTIARMVVDEGRGLVIAANKWDLVADPEAARRQLEDRIERSLPQIRGVRTVGVSALEGRGLERLMDTVLEVHDLWNRRVTTADLNGWLGEVTSRHPPPLADGRPVRIRYATQIKVRPPTFAFFVNKPADLPESYMRYLGNGLREAFGLWGVPLRLVVRKGKNPYA